MIGRDSVFLVVLAFLALLGSLVLVVWRQGRVLEVQRELGRVEAVRGVAQAEAAALTLRVQWLESRGRVVPLAKSRLGLRIPSSEEMVLLPLPPVVVEGVRP